MQDFETRHAKNCRRQQERYQRRDSVIDPPRWPKQDVSISREKHSKHDYHERSNEQCPRVGRACALAHNEPKNHNENYSCRDHENCESSQVAHLLNPRKYRKRSFVLQNVTVSVLMRRQHGLSSKLRERHAESFLVDYFAPVPRRILGLFTGRCCWCGEGYMGCGS